MAREVRTRTPARRLASMPVATGRWRQVRARLAAGPALFLGAFFMLALFAGIAAAQGAPRTALVIGNNTYDMAPLDNPVNDARSISAVLREVGFDVLHIENTDRKTLESLPARIRERFPEGGVGLFYYAGHAVQYRGTNYLLPTDFQPVPPDELGKAALPVDLPLQALQTAGVKLSVMILDACRNNPFGEASGAYGPGLANMQRIAGENLTFYAAAEGKVALDGEGVNSPFTAALVNALSRPGLDIYDIARQVRGSVRMATQGQQIPFVSGSIESRFVFREAGSEPAPVQTASADKIDLAAVHWNAIQRSADPGDFKTFMDTYPQSPLVKEAAVRRQELGPAAAPAVEIVYQGPRVAGGLADIVTQCDLVAADPNDSAKVTAGIEPLLVNTRLAIPTCARDVAKAPTNGRLLYQLGRALMLAERFDEAAAFFGEAIKHDYAAAHYGLGYMYRNALGRERDLGRAFKGYRSAALLGMRSALISTGVMFREGWGVPQSDAEAFNWIRLAAEQGSRDANDALANMYLEGRGTAKNVNRAIEHYTRAAQLGSTNAMNNLGRVYRDGIGVPVDMTTAVDWFNRSIALGNGFAAEQLGRMYARGKGLPKDPRRARALLELAIDRGNEWALFHMGNLLKDGALGEPDPLEAYFFYEIARLVGESIDNTGSSRLAEQSKEAMTAIEGKIDPRLKTAALAQAGNWFEQNGTARFVFAKGY